MLSERGCRKMKLCICIKQRSLTRKWVDFRAFSSLLKIADFPCYSNCFTQKWDHFHSKSVNWGTDFQTLASFANEITLKVSSFHCEMVSYWFISIQQCLWLANAEFFNHKNMLGNYLLHQNHIPQANVLMFKYKPRWLFVISNDTLTAYQEPIDFQVISPTSHPSWSHFDYGALHREISEWLGCGCYGSNHPSWLATKDACFYLNALRASDAYMHQWSNQHWFR